MESTQSKAVSVPLDLGELKLVPRGWNWRAGQRELAQKIVSSPKKVILLEAECGTGKSMIPLAAARTLNKQALVLIETIQLQRQYERDFKLAGAELMMGRSHFTCNVNRLPADSGPCAIGMACDKKGQRNREEGGWIVEPTCEYFVQKHKTRQAPIMIQNYAFWLRETQEAERSTFLNTPIIICDEAHQLDSILMQAAIFSITQRDLTMLKVDTKEIQLTDLTNSTILERWCRIVGPQLASIEEAEKLRLQGLGINFGEASGPTPEAVDKNQLEVFRAIRRVSSAISAAHDVTDEEWVFDVHPDGLSVAFKPIFGKYGFRRLMESATEKLILMSAFLAPKMLMQTLGLTDAEVEIIEAPPVFDRKNSPILFTPVKKFGFKSTDEDWKYATRVAEELTSTYRQQNMSGLIHVPSLELRNRVRTFWKDKMNLITYEANSKENADQLTKEDALEIFRQSEGQVLLGQSISTGVDLREVKFQVIMKMWFQSTADPVTKRRAAVDPMYEPYYTICQIVQAAGRAKRAADHDSPTFILDTNFLWFYKRHQEHFPKWFKDALNQYGWDHAPQVKNRLERIAVTAGAQYVTPGR